jgi:hypothetical protein
MEGTLADGVDEGRFTPLGLALPLPATKLSAGRLRHSYHARLYCSCERCPAPRAGRLGQAKGKGKVRKASRLPVEEKVTAANAKRATLHFALLRRAWRSGEGSTRATNTPGDSRYALLDPRPCLFERVRILRQIRLVLMNNYKRRSVGMYKIHTFRQDRATSRPTAKCPGRT